MTVAVRWADGTAQEAASWGAMLEHIGTSRWEASSTLEARTTLRARALVWSGTVILEGGSNRDFFIELERAGLLTIVSEGGS